MLQLKLNVSLLYSAPSAPSISCWCHQSEIGFLIIYFSLLGHDCEIFSQYTMSEWVDKMLWSNKAATQIPLLFVFWCHQGEAAILMTYFNLWGCDWEVLTQYVPKFNLFYSSFPASSVFFWCCIHLMDVCHHPVLTAALNRCFANSKPHLFSHKILRPPGLPLPLIFTQITSWYSFPSSISGTCVAHFSFFSLTMIATFSAEVE